jgi:hypothetical protein
MHPLVALSRATVVPIVVAKGLTADEAATVNDIDMTPYEGKGLLVLVATNRAGATPTLDVKAQEADTTGGTFTDVTDTEGNVAAFAQVGAGTLTAVKVIDCDASKARLGVLLDIAGTSSPEYDVCVLLIANKKQAA